MHAFCKALLNISHVLPKHKADFSSVVSPIKMSFNVYESKTTDINVPPLMIMHGFFGAKQNWRGRGKALESKTKRKVYSLDVRNHGNSPKVPEHSPECIAADIALLMQEENLKQISIMGYSMGGRAVMDFVLRYPKLVEKAIVIDVSPVSTPKNCVPIQDILSLMKSINLSAELSLANGRAIVERQMLELVQEKAIVDIVLLNLRKLQSGEFVWALNISALDNNGSMFSHKPCEMPAFNGPVLFIGGTRSDYLNPADWPKIKELFPNAELEWLDAGHLVHLDQPEKFLQLVSNFLNS